MKRLKKMVWTARKDGVRLIRTLGGAKRARGLIGLSLSEAQTVYGGRKDVTVHPFFRKNETAIAPPKHLPEDGSFSCSLFSFPQSIPDYEAVLLDIRNPDFTFQHHHLLDDQRRVIYEPHLHFDDLAIKKAFLSPCKKLTGTVAYLGNTLFCQYGHWIQIQMPMLLAYWETFGREAIDYYYIGDGAVKDFAEESLLRMGVRKEQILGFPCRADRSLIAVKQPYTDGRKEVRTGFRMNGPAFRFLQEVLFKARPMADGAGLKKLFVMRGNVSGRKELNLAEIRSALEPLGFRFVTTQGKTMQEEADLFGNADVIIGVHGAALHNLLFSRPGTQVIEIFPYDYFEESNYILACHGGLDYHYLLGEPVGNEGQALSLMQRNRADVLIGREKLLRLCEAAKIVL